MSEVSRSSKGTMRTFGFTSREPLGRGRELGPADVRRCRRGSAGGGSTRRRRRSRRGRSCRRRPPRDRAPAAIRAPRRRPPGPGAALSFAWPSRPDLGQDQVAGVAPDLFVGQAGQSSGKHRPHSTFAALINSPLRRSHCSLNSPTSPSPTSPSRRTATPSAPPFRRSRSGSRCAGATSSAARRSRPRSTSSRSTRATSSRSSAASRRARSPTRRAPSTSPRRRSRPGAACRRPSASALVLRIARDPAPPQARVLRVDGARGVARPGPRPTATPPRRSTSASSTRARCCASRRRSR